MADLGAGLDIIMRHRFSYQKYKESQYVMSAKLRKILTVGWLGMRENRFCEYKEKKEFNHGKFI